MKSIYRFILLCLLVSSGCNKDSVIIPHDFPYVVMKEVNASEDGAEFIADVQNLGSSPIISYGFVWSDTGEPVLSESFSKSIDSEITTGKYSLNVSSDLVSDVRYFVRPYIQSEKYLVYGNPVSFTSKGSADPELIDFEPKNGNSGDTIVIKGKNFSVLKSRVRVSLGMDVADLVSSDFEKIKIVIPRKLSKTGEVPLIIKSGESILQASSPFLINGHRVTGFEPETGMIGESEIEISGTGFDPANLTVWFGDHKAEIISANESMVRVLLPYSLTAGETYIQVEINGRKAESEKTFKARSRWSKLKNFPGEQRVLSSCAVFNNYFYLLAGMKDPNDLSTDLNDFWRYDCLNDQWDQLPDFPGTKRSSGASFILNGNIYSGFGVSNFASFGDFWKYNTRSNTWTQLKNFPGSPKGGLIYFSLDNKGYVLFGNYSGSTDVWKYDPEPDEWTFMGHPDDIISYLDARDMFFQTSENAYIVPVTFTMPAWRSICEFVPGNNKLIISNMITISDAIYDYRISAFSLNNQLYFLSGGENKETIFWKYDLTSGKWTRLENFPQAFNIFQESFASGGSGYVVIGKSAGNSVNSNEVWVYNPNSN